MSIEEDWDEIYRCLGEALFSAQMLEHNIVNSIIYHDFVPNRLSSSSSAEFHGYSEDQFAKTMGRMLKTLREVLPLDPQLENHLNECVRARNWIAHNFFKERFGHFETPDDRLIIISELKSASEKFEKANYALFDLTILAAEKLGIPTEQLQKNIEAHMARFK